MILFHIYFRFSVEEARYAEFSRTGLQDRVVATYGKMAKVSYPLLPFMFLLTLSFNSSTLKSIMECLFGAIF